VASRRRGFSLVELMVVIGIIAILIALLLPTLSIAREHAKQIKCAAQLHSLGQAFANYAVAFKGAYPACSSWQVYGGDGTGDDEPGPGWTEELEPYYAKAATGVFHCPSWEDPTLINYFIETRWLILNHKPLVWHVGEIPLSAQFVLAGECSNDFLYVPPNGTNSFFTHDDCDKDSGALNNLPFFGEENGRNVHRGGNNVLFADFHVATFRKFEPTSMTFHPSKPGVSWYELTDEREQQQ
jgi:prepilin-type N-terminal cleavage/methylation domain-containing protein/prepilin-type processing-associated H-X9-DG protein